MVYRTAFFFPYVASLVAVGAVWNMLFQPEFGPVNEFLKFVGVAYGARPIDWAMIVIIVSVWKYMGSVGVPGRPSHFQDLYEAASIDGATGFKKFAITIPMLKPTTFFVIMMTIQCFKALT